MKSVLLTLVFVLGTATSFATNSIAEDDGKKFSATVNTSCGVTGMIMFDSFAEAIELAMEMDEWLCG